MRQYSIEERAAILKESSQPNGVNFLDAPVWVQNTILESRERKARGENVESRSWSFAPAWRRITTAVRDFVAEDRALRAKANEVADRIRQDEIRDASCTAVKFVNGKFERDYAREEEIRAQQKVEQADLLRYNPNRSGRLSI